jgi:hypothetical protein
MVQSQPGQMDCKTLSQKNKNQHKKCLVEWLNEFKNHPQKPKKRKLDVSFGLRAG